MNILQNNPRFQSIRISTQFNIAIDADPDAVFALACPKAELQWIDHWQYEMIYSESGKNENNCIFKENMSGLFVLNSQDMTTCWYTTLYDQQARNFHALLMFGDAGVGKFEFAVKKTENEKPDALWRLTFTALNETGNRLADPGLKDRMTGMLQFLGESAKYFLETGNKMTIG